MESGVAGGLWTHPQVHDVQQLLHGPAAQKRLRDRLSQLLPNTHALGRCRLEWADFKPGDKLVAHYRIEAHRQGDGASDLRPIALTWTPQGTGDDSALVPSLEELQRDAQLRNLTGPWQRLGAYFPECCLQVQVWPVNNRFPQLVRLSDPRHVRDMIAAANARLPGTSDCLVAPVRYHPGERHVLKYTPADRPTDLTGPRAVFAKLYDSPASAEGAFRVANRAGELLAAGGRALRTLRPLACVAEDAVILHPALSGTPLCARIRHDSPGLAEQLRQAGSMLRILHSAGFESRGPGHAAGAPSLFSDLLTAHRGFAKEVKKMTRRTCAHIQALLPDVGACIAEVLDRALAAHEALPQEPAGFIHGDFKTEHLWIEPAGLTLLDFDTCSVGDPAIDVGKFLADLTWWYMTCRQPGIEEAQAHFLDAYAGGAMTDRLKRARVYEALALIRLTVHRTRLFDRNWAGETRGLVERSANLLGRAVR